MFCADNPGSREWRFLPRLAVTLLLRDTAFCWRWLSPWWIPKKHCLLLSDRDSLRSRQRERVKLLNPFQSTARDGSRSGNHARESSIQLQDSSLWCPLVAVMVPTVPTIRWTCRGKPVQ
jgi:hypothetical protein